MGRKSLATVESATGGAPAATSAAADPAEPASGTPRPDFPLAGHTGVLLHKAGLLIQEEVDQALAAQGFRLRTFMVLATLAGGAELSQQDLSRVVSLDPTTMVALIDELEQAGQVERRRNPADRRRYILGLTEVGRRAMAEAEVVASEAERLFFARLPEGRRELLHDMLGTLLENRWPSAVCN
ncbi:DNA-binding MarR family transcriptional regulator [Kitasatospora sp. MAP12-15]|uniref:MarR family winged helix-turn-helix transcriptional regulator n=1 Tax=unclassified Kitasatospora TaxID=2633591 RepID=UPI002473F1B3|nr:MarR family winged helix-turn-helix transcriptional regulator [Kitasatospora sp. MAP12-44]MDH6112442.1 DNA-binding MarR family transcriptional regulator [Kitasatospora sp. MAP12-44]